MMPDISPADVFTWVGTAIGAAVAAWGLRHGEKDKGKSAVATPEAAATATAGIFDAATQREIALDSKRTADATEELHKTVKDYLRSIEDQKAKDKQAAMEDRVESVEDKLDRLLRIIDGQERGGRRRDPKAIE